MIIKINELGAENSHVKNKSQKLHKINDIEIKKRKVKYETYSIQM